MTRTRTLARQVASNSNGLHILEGGRERQLLYTKRAANLALWLAVIGATTVVTGVVLAVVSIVQALA